jgi:NADPH:quinone reductase-like Zn-dependent oxidoreductase
MKAVAFKKTGDISNLEIIEIERPGRLKRGEVRLQFLAGSLNHLDLWVLQGLPRIQYSFPHLCGADICGRVIESKSPRFKVGDTVLVYPAEGSGSPENLSEDFKIRGENAPGVFCEELVVSDRYLIRSPRHLTPEEAASLPLVYLTAWQMIVEKAGLNRRNISRERILVHGAGSGVTQALLEILISLGAKKLAVTSRHADKISLGKKRGIVGFVLGERTHEEIKEWAGRDRVSIIFDHIGEALFEMNIKLLKVGGKFITCGATSGYRGNLDLRHLYFRQLHVLGSTMGSLKHFHEVIRWVDKNKIHPQISCSFAFDKIKKAYELLQSQTQSGKVVLTSVANSTKGALA